MSESDKKTAAHTEFKERDGVMGALVWESKSTNSVHRDGGKALPVLCKCYFGV